MHTHAHYIRQFLTALDTKDEESVQSILKDCIEEFDTVQCGDLFRKALQVKLTLSDDSTELTNWLKDGGASLLLNAGKEKVRDNLINYFIGNSLSPGTDFSLNSDYSFNLGHKARGIVYHSMPPDIQSILYPHSPLIENPDNALEEIEAHLKVPFLKNLSFVCAYRTLLLPSNQLSYYFNMLIEGIKLKTGIDVSESLSDKLGTEFFLKLYDEYEGETTTAWATDIVSCAGFSREVVVDISNPDDYWLTDKGLAVLSLLWANPLTGALEYHD